MSEPHTQLRLRDAAAAGRRIIATTSLPSDSYPRLRERLASRRRHRPLVFALAASTAVMLLAVGMWRARAPQIVCGFEVVARATGTVACSAADRTAVEVRDATVTLRLRELATDIVAAPGTQLRRETAGIRLARGRATFAVGKRDPAAPLRVLVSHGVIEVVGTRFTVTQQRNAGDVALASGNIRFVASDGRVVHLTPGQSLSWPLPTPQVVPHDVVESPARPEHRQRLARREILAELEDLRIRREYGTLARRLEGLLTTERREPLRERLSYELCDVLARHTKERQRACLQIETDLRQYPAGEYAAMLLALRSELACK
ncbi:MAG: FecR domain-containing protein [Myxococcota bacterium]